MGVFLRCQQIVTGRGTMDREELLQPTFAKHGRVTVIYSAQATFFTVFLGGPVAAAITCGLNSQRVGRLKKHALVYALGLVVFVGFTYAYFADPAILQSAGDTAPDHCWSRSGHCRPYTPLDGFSLYLPP